MRSKSRGRFFASGLWSSEKMRRQADGRLFWSRRVIGLLGSSLIDTLYPRYPGWSLVTFISISSEIRIPGNWFNWKHWSRLVFSFFSF